RESRRKALAVSLGIIVPMLCTNLYTQLLVYGIVQGPVTNVPWFLGALVMMASELGRDFILSGRERLELAEVRNQLAQVDRVSVLGQLASTLAHELTQPLAATSANVEAGLAQLRSETPDLEELRAILNDIGSDDRRAAEIIDRMRQLLKRRTIEMQPLRVEDVVEGVVSLVRREATSKHVVLNLSMQPGLHGEIQYDMFRGRFPANQGNDTLHHVLYAKRLHFDRASLEKLAHAVDDFGGTAVVAADVVQNRAQLLEIRGLAPKLCQPCLHVGRGRCQWLGQLVRQRGCQLSQHADAIHLRQL